MGKISQRVSWEIIKKSFFPFFILFLFLAGYFTYRIKLQVHIPEEIQENFEKYIACIPIICVTFILQRIIGAVLGWYKEQVALKTRTTLDEELIPIVRRTLKVILWLIALLIILPLFGVNISALIATLGVGSLAIALAAQDTIANIISGFMIMVDRPFRIADKIKLPSGEVVKVLNIGVRRSKFLAEDGSIIIVPNLDLSKSKIVNYTYGKERNKDTA